MLWNSIQTFSFFNCLLNPGSAPFHCPTFYDQVPSFKLPPRNFSPISNQHCLTWGKRFPENWSKFVSFFQSSVNNLNQVSCLWELNELRVKSVTKKKTFLLCSKEEPHEVLNPFEALPWKPPQWQWWCEDGFKVAEEATMGSGPPCHGLHLLVSHQSATRDQPASHQIHVGYNQIPSGNRFAQFATNIVTLLVGKKLNKILASYNLVKKDHHRKLFQVPYSLPPSLWFHLNPNNPKFYKFPIFLPTHDLWRTSVWAHGPVIPGETYNLVNWSKTHSILQHRSIDQWRR